MQTIFSRAEEVRNEGRASAICIVIETQGSTPRKPGSKMIVFADGTIEGSVGGGSVEKEVVERAVKLIASGKPEKCTFKLEEELGMHCGGLMEVYIEPINPVQKLYIYGAGHVGRAVALFAAELDFSVTLIDPRENIFADPLFSKYTCLNREYFGAIDSLLFDGNTYSVIVTPKHAFDEEILARIARKPHAYIGMIGSTRKVETARKRFIEEKILTEEELEQIDMPIGIRLRAETPREIAICIVAKLIDVRNGRMNSNS
jgi:xanthine dehydrogenase accessory factor